MKKVAFHSFGCRTNQEEITAFVASFKERGYEVVKDVKEADILVVNSCSVTAIAENKVKKYLTSMGNKNPNVEIVVTGCLAQQSPQELKEIQGVSLVIGNNEKKNLPDLVVAHGGGIFAEEITAESSIATPEIIEAPEIANRTRFSVKVQEGCNHVCSYCIVPALRGPSRSVPIEDVISTVKRAVEVGYKELVITGTHIGQYRDGDIRFIEMLQEILAVDDSFRIRLSSMNAVDCTDELFELMVNEPRICRHLHVSAQALSREMLKIMKRSQEGMERLLPRLKKYRPLMKDLTIGGDFIVGMPGETEELFAITADRLAEFGFSYGHVFKYSPRPGTVAAESEDQISSAIKEQRSKILRDRLQNLHTQFVESLIGEEFEIISEKVGDLSGISGNYLRFNKKSDKYKKNEIVKCRITSYNKEIDEINFDILGS